MTSDLLFALSGAIVLFVLSSAGSLIGTSIAASAAIGAWKKNFAQNKPASFAMVAYIGMTMTNSLYGMILMFVIIGQKNPMVEGSGIALFALCVIVGLAIGLAAVVQARAAAAACDAYGETGQGLTNNLTAIGIIEGVTMFIVAFSLVVFGNFFPKPEAATAAVEATATVIETVTGD